jgi:hypothetical protein
MSTVGLEFWGKILGFGDLEIESAEPTEKSFSASFPIQEKGKKK